MKKREDLIREIKEAANSGSLLIPKHDINSKTSYASFRTVLTQSASSSLQELINSEEYDLEAYYNNFHKKYAYKLTPYDTSSYNTVGLGIPSGSLTTIGSFDTFLLVSGSANGWHIYAEDSLKIKEQISSSLIEFKGKL